ncbi:VWA domain-containing protein [Vibrio astriarenae]|uniref:VWA domain-containing protein n=1 Tax=Vibrio astriarenae TaxID=1481923 RepID=UPI00373548F6
MFDWQNWQLFFTQFHFIRPLWLLALFPAALLIYSQWEKTDNDNWQQSLPSHLKKALTLHDSGWQSQLPLKILGLILGLSIITCAGPTWQREASPFGEDKAQVVFVLDISSSMTQTDVPPTRLGRAKHKITDLIKLRGGGNNALIAYAGSAHIAMPMTQDGAILTPFLQAIEPQVMPVAGKSLASTLPVIESLLSPDSGGSVVLLSDGVNANDIDRVADYFNRTSNSLVILAIGNRSSNSSNPTGFEDLGRLARSANGNLVELSIDNSDIKQIERLIERNMQLNGDSTMPWKDMGYALLLPIVLFTLLWFRKGWLVQWAIVACLVTPSLLLSHNVVAAENELETKTHSELPSPPSELKQFWWDLWFTRDQQGQRLFDQGRYLEAALQFEDPLYRGVAYYYGRDYLQAQAAFIEADQDLALLYAGMALARQREYLATRQLFESLLSKEELDPNIQVTAKQNLAAVNAIIEEIERYSESQRNSISEKPEESIELGDNPQTSEGAEEEVVQELLMSETLNANEILGSEELAQRWLDRIESDPSLFLQNKFYLQLESDQLDLNNNDKE